LTGVFNNVLIANADIFFDASLFRLSGADDRRVPPLRETRTVLALLKWRLNTEDESLSIELRTDSQGKYLLLPSGIRSMVVETN
jgi:hypothetical protein